MTEKNKLEEEQLSQASGGDGDRGKYKPKRQRPCKRCGEKEDTLFLDTHGGLCRRCVATMCPVCGGTLKLAPRSENRKAGYIKLICQDCGEIIERPQ